MPETHRQSRLAPQLGEELERIGKVFPDLRQERRAEFAVFEDDAVAAAAKAIERLRFACRGDRFARRQHRDLDTERRTLGTAHGREPGIAVCRAIRVVRNVIAERPVGIHGTDASAQLTDGIAKGHESGALLAQPLVLPLARRMRA